MLMNEKNKFRKAYDRLYTLFSSPKKCFTSKLCLFHISLFRLFKYLVKSPMQYINPTGGGGGAQSNGLGPSL